MTSNNLQQIRLQTTRFQNQLKHESQKKMKNYPQERNVIPVSSSINKQHSTTTTTSQSANISTRNERSKDYKISDIKYGFHCAVS
jgi:hypothetical protein